jgi:CPA1 family monovalent cation:H+ antiporter
MDTFELIVALMAAVVALVWLANRFNLPYPMLLMAGGLALAIMPWTPTIELDPEVVLVIFLPPILFQAAQTTSLREFKANFGSISRLAIGLVLVTTALVAVVAHWIIPGIGWPAAFVLGAVVSPPDAVAATAIFQRLGAPQRIVTILEGESLINDASAIVVYTFAVAAVVTGGFSLADGLLSFVLVVVIGLLVGFLAGRFLGRLVMLLGDPSLSMIALLLAPAATYVIAEQVGGSGVLAVVTMGLIHGYTSSSTMTPSSRIRGLAIWDLTIIMVNGLVFILMGLELGVLREVLSRQDIWETLWHAVAVLAAMVVARFVYVFGGSWILRRRKHGASRDRDPRFQFVIAWSGLRGVVSLATALALPLVTDSGAAFDHRDEIILITAFVIIVTLFGFGLPLPWILRKLKFADDGSHERELKLAWTAVRRAMFDQMRQSMDDSPELAAMMKPMMKEFEARFDKETAALESDKMERLQDLLEPQTLSRQKAINAGRDALLELRDSGAIGDEVRRDIERNLDLQELQLSV